MCGDMVVTAEQARYVAQEAYRLGYRRGVADHASGVVKLTETPTGYVIEKEEREDVPEDAATDRRQGA